MSEERFERMEGMLAQLIQMVADTNKTVNNTEGRMDRMESRMEQVDDRMDRMEQRFEAESELNRLRHQELLKESRNLIFEVDHLRNQSAKHDAEIYKLKQLQS